METTPKKRRNRIQPDIDTHLLRFFIGEKKQHYYIRKWSKGVNSWNWAAFFFSVFWLGYRKMYKQIIFIMGIFLITDLFVTILGLDDTILNNAISFAVAFTLGITGNNFYRLYALKKIREMMKGSTIDPNLLQKDIQIRGGTSWKGIFTTLGLFVVYVLIAMAIFTFVPSINKTTETHYDFEFEVIELLENNIQALESENIDEYMSMLYVDDNDEQTQQMIREIFENFDLAYEMSDYEFLSISEKEVKVRVTQTTTIVDGEDYRDNESIIIHTLRAQKEKWKFFESEVESIRYLDEDKLVQDILFNESTYITLQAPSMFEFIVTEKIDVNNDGALEKVSFKGGSEESYVYLNENVEIIVEFDTGEISSLKVSAENAPILYLYDIDRDGWMEVFFETGARLTGTEMYQFTSNGLAHATTLNGSVEKFNPNEVITSEGKYIFDQFLKIADYNEVKNDNVTD